MNEIVEITGADLDMLLALMSKAADLTTYKIRVAIDGGLKVKVNEEMWSRPYGAIHK